MIGASEPVHQEANRSNSGGGLWDYISPSRLNTWMSCPLKFRLRYIDGIRSPTTPALFLGKQVHRGLEIYYRHRMLGITLEPNDVGGRIVDGWDAAVADEEMKFATGAEEVALEKQAVDLVAAYLAQVPADEPPPLAVEATMEAPLVDPVTGENLGIPLLGIVDLIAPTDNGPVIVDFKTSSRSSPPFEISHEIQLTAYSYMFRKLTGQREAGLQIRSLIKTKKPRIEQHEYAARSDQHLARFFSVIREYVDALDTGRFNYRPSWSGCAMCDHRDGALPKLGWLIRRKSPPVHAEPTNGLALAGVKVSRVIRGRTLLSGGLRAFFLALTCRLTGDRRQAALFTGTLRKCPIVSTARDMANLASR